MSETLDYLAHAVLIGAGATAVMDLWAVARKKTPCTVPRMRMCRR